MKPILLITLISFLASCSQHSKDEVPTQVKDKPLNVILLIGDGMGLSQVSSTYYYQDAVPSFNRFKHIGLINTTSASHKITDSAAGAVAFACGKKSYNGAIGVDADSTTVKSITEILNEQGYANGLISTSSITHATPACFFAHVDNRNKKFEIARAMNKGIINFFAGGGKQFFKDSEENKDLLKQLASNNYVIDTSELTNTSFDSSKNYGYLLADNAMPKVTEGRGDFLPDAFELAAGYLSTNEKGFFLMVEGSQIDWGGHNNDAEYLIEEMKDFDKVIHAAIDFAEKDGNTLVIVTADHEAGGFSLSPKVTEEGNDYDQIEPTFSTTGHTTTLIPVFAYGVGAEKFSGVYQNTDIFYKILESVNL